MHEKSTACRTREAILDHPKAKNMDPHERSELTKRTAKMSQRELDKKRRELNR